MRIPMMLGLLLAAGPAWANPPVDEMHDGGCLELKLDGKPTPFNHTLRLVDDGAGEGSFVTGYGDGQGTAKTVLALFTAQARDMENAYGYALRLTEVTLMPFDKPAGQRMWKAAGLCFIVKPNPVRPSTQAVRQDIVVACPAHLSDAAAPPVRRIDWKFVF